MNRRTSSSINAGKSGENPTAHGRRQQIRFFTIAEVAEMLRVATRTVRRWIDDGKLVAHRLGRSVRIADSDLHAFLAIHRQG
jgi:excisionase family DNA binding protein